MYHSRFVTMILTIFLLANVSTSGYLIRKSSSSLSSISFLIFLYNMQDFVHSYWDYDLCSLDDELFIY